MSFPPTCETGIEQERTADPSTCTVQAPHNPAPHPNFVPVIFKVSRKTQSSGVSGATLTLRSLPFTRSEISAMCSPNVIFAEGHHRTEIARKGELRCGCFRSGKVTTQAGNLNSRRTLYIPSEVWVENGTARATTSVRPVSVAPIAQFRCWDFLSEPARRFASLPEAVACPGKGQRAPFVPPPCPRK
jgi:hypothetical protein